MTDNIYPEIVNEWSCTRNAMPAELHTIYAQSSVGAKEQMKEKYPDEISQGFTAKRVKTVVLREPA